MPRLLIIIPLDCLGCEGSWAPGCLIEVGDKVGVEHSSVEHEVLIFQLPTLMAELAVHNGDVHPQ